MKKNGLKSNYFVLITGLLVFGIPVIFLNFLSNKIVSRTRETTSELLREKILQELESFKSRLKPANYVKHIIRKVHTEVLPEIKPEIVRLFPDKSFGADQFNQTLPPKFVAGLKSYGLEALLFISNSVEFSKLDYYFSEDLKKQIGKEARDLAISFSHNNFSVASSLYLLNYQKKWDYKFNPCLTEILNSCNDDPYMHEEVYTRYITRFSDRKTKYEEVFNIFTDYFGSQFLFAYNYYCISKKNVHGAYTVIVRQDSIKTGKILEFAQNAVDQTGLTCSVIQKNKNTSNGFHETPDHLTYIAPMPSIFFAHLMFLKDLAGSNQKDGLSTNLQLKVQGSFPKELKNQILLNKFIKFFSCAIGLAFLMFSIHSLLFGLTLPFSIRKKLTLVLGIIVLIPISGTGILSYYLLSGYERIVESHLLALVQNKLDYFSRQDDENKTRKLAKFLKIKNLLETSNEPVEKILDYRSFKNLLPSAWEGITGFSYIDEKGLFNDFRKSGPQSNKLVEGVMTKYVMNQGLLKASGAKLQEMEMRSNLTMGVFEGFLTPEIEELIAPHEGTLQREITHTVDVHLGMFLVVLRDNKQNLIAFLRSRSSDLEDYKYLRLLNLESPGIFSDQISISDIKTGIRLRSGSDFTLSAWPAEVIFDFEMSTLFQKAMQLRANGSKVLRSPEGLEIKAWRYKESQGSVIAAMGKTRRLSDIGFSISMVFPAVLGYAIIVLVFLTSSLAEILLKPLEFFQTGIAKINSDNFGVTISEFSQDEFNQVTTGFNQMSVALKQKELISRYVSEKLLQSIENQDQHKFKNEILEVSILASDIRGFTSITEKHSPMDVVEMLNSYFTMMEESILENNGIIDKYIGDAIQAIFYPDPKLPTTSHRACMAALKMREKLELFNSDRQKNSLFTIENGIGIATGNVISGSLGSEIGRKAYTVTGKVTEFATQLEARTPSTQSKIIVCQKTFESCNEFKFGKFDSESYQLLETMQ